MTRAVGLAVLIAACMGTSSARAGTYTVSGCRTAWVPDVRNTTGTGKPEVMDHCDTEGVLRAALDTSVTNNPGDYVGWRFVAPPDTSISGASVRWFGLGLATTANWRALVLETSLATPPTYHVDRFDGVDTVVATDAAWIRASVKCLETPPAPCQPEMTDQPGLFSFVALRSSAMTLVDRLTPVVESASGPAIADTLWTGSEPLAFAAGDRGGGCLPGADRGRWARVDGLARR
jgi:hypothetical protein